MNDYKIGDKIIALFNGKGNLMPKWSRYEMEFEVIGGTAEDPIFTPTKEEFRASIGEVKLVHIENIRRKYESK